MSREKQIEEMARVWCSDNPPSDCAMCVCRKSCYEISKSEMIYDAGYRKQEWISVDERLPDVCGMDVLMAAVNCYGQTNIVKGFTDYQRPIKFLTNEKQYENIWGAWEVTHWMPLPEPPKMKGGVTAESAIRAVQEAALELKNTPPDNLLGIGSTMQF